MPVGLLPTSLQVMLLSHRLLGTGMKYLPPPSHEERRKAMALLLRPKTPAFFLCFFFFCLHEAGADWGWWLRIAELVAYLLSPQILVAWGSLPALIKGTSSSPCYTSWRGFWLQTLQSNISKEGGGPPWMSLGLARPLGQWAGMGFLCPNPHFSSGQSPR